MNTLRRVSMLIPLFALPLASLPVPSGAAPLTLVRDLGGASTRPYYEALHLQSHLTAPAQQSSRSASSAVPAHTAPERRYRESDLLPVRSTRLTPGTVTPRTIHAPGLTPMFLIGTDAASQRWLLQHVERLRALNAIGFVVNVESMEALDSLRRHAPGIALSPASGDDLARRLGLDHYPVLITATGIEP
jgi:integrating conjugative element protein (TIGR03765 family)